MKSRTHDHHRCALRHHQSYHHITHLSFPHSKDASIVRGSLCTTIPTEVVIAPVAVVFSVDVVVLVVVGLGRSRENERE